MKLAEEVEEWDTWLVDALMRGFLWAQRGDVEAAEAALRAVGQRETEMADARFHPWVSLLEAHVAWAAGQDEAGAQAYQAAAEELAEVFWETVFWDVDRDGMDGQTAAERAVEVWRRALRVFHPHWSLLSGRGAHAAPAKRVSPTVSGLTHCTNQKLCKENNARTRK